MAWNAFGQALRAETLPPPEPTAVTVTVAKPEPPSPPEPVAVTVSVSKPEPPSPPEPTAVAVTVAKPEPPPEPAAVTVTVAKPDTPSPPEPTAVTVTIAKPEPPPPPEPSAVTVMVAKPEPPPPPEPSAVTVTLTRPEPPSPPEPTAVTVTVSKPVPPLPPEPTAVTISVERPGVDLSQARAALAACDFGAMKTALEALKAQSDRLNPEGRDLLATLEREGEADAAFGRARERYFAGDLDRAETELEAADATSCPDRQARIAGNRVKIDRLRRLEASAETAISQCRLADIEALSEHLSRTDLVFLTRVRAKLESARGPIASARAHVDGSGPLYRQGDLGAAERRLTKAESRLGKLPERRVCEAMRAEIGDRLTEIGALRRDLARADAAIRACDVSAIERLSARFDGRDHVLIDAKRAELRSAAKRCAKRREEEAVADAERAGRRYCADNYRGGILREVRADGSYYCGCEKGKYADNERKACLTWDEVAANARAACEAEGTILATVRGPGKHRCCPAGTHTYDQASKRCWTWDAMVADAKAQCRRKGQVAAWVNGVNDYLCCPAGSNRFDRKTNTCYNDAAAAQQFIQGLGTIMQGIERNRNRRTRRNPCTNPPRGCHCRPGTTQLHCGSESGGSRKTVAPRPSGPRFTGCRWVRLTIAGFGNRSGWGCRCNEGMVSAQATKYCGRKPN